LSRKSNARFARVLDTLAGGHAPSMLASYGGRRPAFQSLIGTILSARSRDEVTDRVCQKLFKKYPSAARLARAKPANVIPLLREMGFYRQKAKSIIGTSRILMNKHGGRVPDSMEELLELPGVGRKVANCVLVYVFGRPAIPVDTHVHRISNRLGWVRTNSPEQTERELVSLLPKRYWLPVNDLFVSHGKTACRPIGPRCGECSVERWCAKVGVRSGR
jgi:endonuclease-3